MKLIHHVHARSMLRGHAEFWRHAQTVALATTIPERIHAGSFYKPFDVNLTKKGATAPLGDVDVTRHLC